MNAITRFLGLICFVLFLTAYGVGGGVFREAFAVDEEPGVAFRPLNSMWLTGEDLDRVKVTVKFTDLSNDNCPPDAEAIEFAIEAELRRYNFAVADTEDSQTGEVIYVQASGFSINNLYVVSLLTQYVTRLTAILPEKVNGKWKTVGYDPEVYFNIDGDLDG